MSRSPLFLVLLALVAFAYGFQLDSSISTNERIGDQLRARFNSVVSSIGATTSSTSSLTARTALSALSRTASSSKARLAATGSTCVPRLIGSPQAPVTPAPTRRPVTRRPVWDFIDDCGGTGFRSRPQERRDQRQPVICRRKRTLPNDDVRKCCKVIMPHEVRSSTRSIGYSCTKYRSARTSTKCGLFGWGRCGKSKRVSERGTCYRAQTLYQQEQQCCPSQFVACCAGTVYIEPRTIHLTTGLTINLVKSCVTVDEFTAIILELERLGLGK